MNIKMNINRKILNWSLIITLLIAYIIPGKSSDGFAFDYGYPFGFFTMYNSKISYGDTIFNSTLLNVGGLLLNILVIYCILYVLNKFIPKKLVKRRH